MAQTDDYPHKDTAAFRPMHILTDPKARRLCLHFQARAEAAEDENTKLRRVLHNIRHRLEKGVTEGALSVSTCAYLVEWIDEALGDPDENERVRDLLGRQHECVFCDKLQMKLDAFTTIFEVLAQDTYIAAKIGQISIAAKMMSEVVRP